MWCGQGISLKAVQRSDHGLRFGRWALCLYSKRKKVPCFWIFSVSLFYVNSGGCQQQYRMPVVQYDWSVGLLYWGRWKCNIKWKLWVGVYCKGRRWVVKIASVELFRSAGFVVVKRGCHFTEACQRSRPASQPSWHFQTVICVLSFLMVNSKLKNKDSLYYEASCALREVSIFFFLFFLLLVIANVYICERNTLIFLSFIHSSLSFICSLFFSFLLS